MRDAYLDSMAKVMVDAVNTEGYAQATGAMLENSLTVSAPFREAMEKSMLQVLQQLSMPSRQDFSALADRFTNLEMRLDDIDAKLDRIEKQTPCVRAGPAKRAGRPEFSTQRQGRETLKPRHPRRRSGRPNRHSRISGPPEKRQR